MTSALEILGLSHTYASRRKDAPRRALKDIAFSVEPKEIFGLLGPNGGGKSTLFKILSTALQPTAGTAKIFGVDVLENPAEVRKKIGVVFQSPSLDKKLTVAENLRHQGHLYGLSGNALEERISDLLRRVGCLDRARDFAETLSGGLQRRVEIAKGMIHRPELLLMDEPSTGLDPGSRKDLWDYLQELKSSGMTILVTTHLMEEAEKCDRVAILNEGVLVAMDRPAALKNEIGGDVISVEARDPRALVERIRASFGLDAVVLEDNTVRIEKDRGHEFVPQLVQSFPQEILSVMLGKPTLEDVFFRRTGHKFWSERADRS
jgi:ABC-2 type transport system ATP-binding protein